MNHNQKLSEIRKIQQIQDSAHIRGTVSQARH